MKKILYKAFSLIRSLLITLGLHLHVEVRINKSEEDKDDEQGKLDDPNIKEEQEDR